MYSLTNSPALAYDLALLLDKGFEPAQWTSARLKDEVLYLETARDRYELRVDGSRDGFAVYTLCRVLDPLSLALSPDAVVPVKLRVVAQGVDGSASPHALPPEMPISKPWHKLSIGLTLCGALIRCTSRRLTTP